MASKPTSKFMSMIDNFDVLDEIKGQLAVKACEGIVTYEPPRGKTNNVVSDQVRHRPVQAQKRARSLKFWSEVEEELYYPCSENKGADQLNREADQRLCFRLCRLMVFP